MKNLRDLKTKIYPSTTRGGKELLSSFALDSAFVLSKLVTPTPAIDSDMSHVIDDVTSAMHDTYDETASMPDTTVPLGEFLDEQIARAREKEIIESEYDDDSDDENMPVIPEGYLFDQDASLAILACIDRYELKRLLIKWNKESLVIPKGYVFDQEASLAILACKNRNELKSLLANWSKQSLNASMKPDPAFATSPIFVTDKD